MTTPHFEDISRRSEPAPSPGPFLATVIGHLDPNYMGGLEVEIQRAVGNTPFAGQLHQVKYISPFCGVTGANYVKDDPDDFNNAQKSYGMWMVPPDPGTTVIVIFINGDPKRGYWMGCVPDFGMNFMTPGLAGTENAVEPEKADGETLRLPTAEYNHLMNKKDGDGTKFKKPIHPFATMLKDSGLSHDDIRGTTTSSARRETPSMVFGISTPGPLDKNGTTGPIGKKDYEVKNAYVSRLGGSTFVMDDGDDKFLRKKPAKDDKPEYVSPEQGESGGDVDIPHNELVRIRTRKGHQILLHNSEDLIYISHGSGNSWIEMTANGKIDVYAKDSISFHTDNDFNFSAGRDINFKAGGQVNVVSTGAIKLTPTENFEVKAKNTSIDGGDIHLNSDKATKANILVRTPTKEPWAGHENLDPNMFKEDKTKAVESPPEKPEEPEMYKKYTTKTDTFGRVKGPDKEGQSQQ